MKAAYLKLFLPAMALIERAPVLGAERLVGVESARVMSQSMPWIAAETGMFRKYNLEFPLVYIRIFTTGATWTKWERSAFSTNCGAE